MTDAVSLGVYDGRVKWFNADKGYGFITPAEVEEGSQDVFVHHSAIQMKGYRTLEPGERVRYELRQGPKGLHAANVMRV